MVLGIAPKDEKTVAMNFIFLFLFKRKKKMISQSHSLPLHD